MNMKRLPTAALVVGSAALIGAGAFAGASLSDDDSPATPIAVPAQATTAPEQTQPATTPNRQRDQQRPRGPQQATTAAAPTRAGSTSTEAGLRALRVAEQRGDGTAFEIDREDGGQGWSVSMSGGEMVFVDLAGREVLQRYTDGVDVEDQQAIADARVTLADAIRTADRSVDGTLESADIDRDDDFAGAPLLWKLSFDTPVGEVDTSVDATSGQIVANSDD